MLRQRVRDAIVQHASLQPEAAHDVEVGIYNASLQQADAFRILKSWNNSKFVSLYTSKAQSILVNLDPKTYIGNTELSKQVNSGQVKPHKVPFLKPQDTFPERWREVVELKVQRDEYATTVKPVAMTDQFRCKRCKKRECVYQELQLRSADEPATIIVTCISCGNTWRVG